MIASRTSALVAALSLLSLPLHAAVTEEFSGYKIGESLATGQTLGAASAGWTGGWRTASSHVETTARIADTRPLDAASYLDVTLFAPAGQPQKPSGAVSRPYTFPAVPFTLSFRFRPDVADTAVRHFIFDNDIRAAGPGPNATWQIESHAGFWRLIDGGGNGLPAQAIDTDLPVVVGTTYTFTLVIDPARRTWDASISDGKRTVTHKSLFFRAGSVTSERWLHFGANELSAPATGVTMTCAIDSIFIQP